MFLFSKSKIIFFSVSIILFFLIMAPMVFAGEASGVDKALGGLNSTASAGKILTNEKDIPTIIGRVIGAALAFVGVIFFALIIWAGFSWMLAQGKEDQINKAKEIIFAAVLGLIVIFGAYAITNLIAQVFSKATG